MSQNTKSSSTFASRWVRILFPPLGLWPLWANRSNGLVKKLLGTLWIGLCTLLYFGILVGISYQFFGLQIEWRGGGHPSFTWSKTEPDYDRLEAHRRSVPTPASTPLTSFATRRSTAYWTDFRGPNRDGHYDQQPILTNWPASGPRLLWRQPIGGGYTFFVVANGMAYTIELRRKQEAITAYDIETGRESWAHAYDAWFQEAMGGDGPRATPTYHQGRLYSMGALGDLYCLNASNGAVHWKKNIVFENDSRLLPWGIASSPLVVGERLIILAGGPGARTVAAYHPITGGGLWNAFEDKQGYVSPAYVTLAGKPQLLVFSGTRLAGLQVENGELLWEYPWKVDYDITASQPLVLSSNRVFVSSGYGTGCAVIEIAQGGTNLTARAVWKNKNLKNKFTSSVLWQGHVYGLDEDILVCLDTETGERKWKDGRYGYGQLLLASGHLIVLCGDGDVALVRATPDRHVELARFPAISGKTWNHPAIAEGRLLVRNSAEMACFDIATP